MKKLLLLRKGGFMAKSSQAKAGKKLRGAVLSMVLIVMYVLIILLMATLAVVSTAQNRSYSKYIENQAYYTARSALDIYSSSILTDGNYNAYSDTGTAKTYIHTDPTTNVSTNYKQSQGFAMQMDLYSIMAHATTIEEYEGLANKSVFTGDTAANPTTPVFPSLSGTKPTLPYIEYEITMPDVLNDATLKKYGTYVDKSTATTKSTIKVEVLARNLDSTGNHDKDEMYVQITSTVPYQDTTGQVSKILRINNPTTPEMFTNGITSFGAMTGVDNAVIIGGLSTNDDLYYGNTGGVIGQIYCGGKLQLANGGSSISLSENEATFCDGDLSAENSAKYTTIGVGMGGSIDPKKTPVVYATGEVSCGGAGLSWAGGTAGLPKDRITLICQNMTATSNNWAINGDVIILGDLKIDGANSFDVNGNVFVQGNLTIEPGNISPTSFTGNYYVKGYVETKDLDFNDTNLVNVYSPNAITYHYLGVGNADMTDTFVNSCSFLGYNFSKIDFNHAAANIPVDPDDGAEIVLPEITGTSNITECTYKRYIPVFTSAYSDYYAVKDTPDPTTGVHDYLTQVNTLNGGAIENILLSANIVNRVPQADRDVGKYESPDPVNKPLHFNIDSIPITYTSLPANGTVDVNGEQNFRLSPANLNLKLTGTGIANIYIDPGSYSGKILSDDTLTVNFLAPQGTYTWNVANYNQEVYNALSTGIRVNGPNGTDPNALECPKIYFYVDGNSTWNMTQTGWCLLTGYFYGPSTQVNASKGLDGSSYSYFYNNDQVKAGNGSNVTSNPFCIGAMVVGGISGLQNNAVVAFIKPDNQFTINIVNNTIAPIYSFSEYEYRAR